jgi:hypothetical protein
VEKEAQDGATQDNRQHQAGKKADKRWVNVEKIRQMTFFDGFNAALDLAPA